MNTKNNKLPFIFGDGILVVLIFFWPAYGIPLIIAIGLIIYRNKKSKRISMELYNEYLGFEEVSTRLNIKKEEVRSDMEIMKTIIAEEESNLEKEKNKMLSGVEKESKLIKAEINKLKIEINTLQEEKREVKKEIENYEKEHIYKVVDMRDYSDISSMELKNEISLLGVEEKELIKNGEALIVDSEDTKKNINYQIKQLLRSFNAETENILSKLTVANVDTSRNKIVKTYETLNNIFKVDGIEIGKELLDIKLKEANLMYQYQIKIEQEKEQQKSIKEQMVEEEKERREIEREKVKLEKEEKQFKNEVSKLISYLQKTDSDLEKKLYLDKIEELEGKLKLLEIDKENILQREQNTRAGFVYIISNVGSFGEDVYKIGMTRRLEPMDRIKELGSASVPFEFDVHAMIFSGDAPALETILHQYFREQEVNKVNSRKEFFKVDLKDIEEVVKNNHNATVDFTLVAKAEQYRESLRLLELMEVTIE